MMQKQVNVREVINSASEKRIFYAPILQINKSIKARHDKRCNIIISGGTEDMNL